MYMRKQEPYDYKVLLATDHHERAGQETELAALHHTKIKELHV